MTAQLHKVENISDIQKLLYDLMQEFHSICEKHGLYYVIFGGTMLGAVRHHGIIPWDDDIDVCMPRKDYEEFCKIVNEKYCQKFTVKAYPQNKYVYSYAKFCLKDSLLIESSLRPKLSRLMLFIDVFPVDGYPPMNEEKEHFDKLRYYKNSRCYAVRCSNVNMWLKKPWYLFNFIRCIPYRLIGYQYYLKKEIEEKQKYNFDTCEYIAMQGAGWNEKGKLEKKIFLNRKLYKFGNLEVWGIADYDAHLTKLYGDYMTPPPKEKQTSNHSYKLYIKRRVKHEK